MKSLKMRINYYQSKVLAIAACLFVMGGPSVYCQLRLDALTLKPKEIYKIVDSDILVVDTLVMGDSSIIMLDKTKPESFLHFKSAQIGNGCLILGHGKNGLKGKDGLKGKNGNGPCSDGLNGTNGANGGPGEAGSNLSIYVSKVDIIGNLVIDVAGGDGGNGGKGGNGGNGSGGTKVCKGGDAGNGANGGNGGKGGNGGILKVFCNNCSTNLIMLENKKLFYKVFAGYGGEGGQEGSSGNPGLGTKDGGNGKSGIAGIEGVAGAQGFYRFTAE